LVVLSYVNLANMAGLIKDKDRLILAFLSKVEIELAGCMIEFDLSIGTQTKKLDLALNSIVSSV
jgi:hypothetical protein